MPDILIIDDEEAIAWSLRKAFEKAGHRVEVAATAEAGLRKALGKPPQVVFLDVRLPGRDGLSALPELRAAAVIVMTAHGNLATAVQAVAGGAFDYLAKPFDLSQALTLVERALGRHSAESRTSETDSPSSVTHTDGEILGQSAVMQSVFKRIAMVAPTEACVLITGESGTGKELVARAIHANSLRKAKPFLPVHVAALNPNLVESELFGHVRGAFTGADKPREGLLALADGGTVFLDELADIPLAVQAKLLRVLERHEVQPVGSVTPQSVNVRIISATHANLAAAVTTGAFRHDLYYRLNVYPIHLPALRERGEDIVLLAVQFAKWFAPASTPLPTETVSWLMQRAWPGNVRELRNAIEHATIVARGGPIRPEHLPEPTAFPGSVTPREQLAAAVRDWFHERIRGAAPQEPAELYQCLMAEIEPVLIQKTLEQLNGNRLAAGRWLGLARATVRKLIQKYRLGNDD